MQWIYKEYEIKNFLILQFSQQKVFHKLWKYGLKK